jgi:hypothetical protein
MTGIRAYNVLPLLASKQKYFLILLNLEKQIVQYNTPDSSIPVYRLIHLKFHVIRVTDENAAVRF